MIARTSRLVAAGCFALVALVAGPAGATVTPLKRSVENVLQAPLDAVLTPVVAAKTAYTNIGNEDHTAFGDVTLGFVTWTGLVVFDWFASGFRFMSGAFEFPIGLSALAATPFTDKDPPPLMDLSQTPALVDHPTEYFDVKFGVYHVGR